jgi:hypothetical protein
MKAGKSNQSHNPDMTLKKSTGAIRPTERVMTDNTNMLFQKEQQPFSEGGADIMKQDTAKTEPPRESGVFTKRIGSTNYRVSVHFSKTSRETMNDKIMRIIKNDASGKAAGK